MKKREHKSKSRGQKIRCVTIVNSETMEKASFAVFMVPHGLPDHPQKYVAIMLTAGQYGSGLGLAVCAKEDAFDLRVGVNLALQRAVGHTTGTSRKDLIQGFHRAWPEMHPEYRVKTPILYRPEKPSLECAVPGCTLPAPHGIHHGPRTCTTIQGCARPIGHDGFHCTTALPIDYPQPEFTGGRPVHC